MSSNTCPSKSEIQQVFKRLSSVQANKVCFDCNSKNPTWASVTYGIFICIDCSGIHRSLGVHLTFVRSTQLDSNWTWQQIRQMQLGGNSNATSFFRQHNCVTSDAQQKYKSRAAQLYRDKLHHMASQAMRLHGTKLFIEAKHNTPSVGDEEDAAKNDKDFFDAHEEEALNEGATFGGSESSMTSSASVSLKSSSIGVINADLSDQGPNVEAALAVSAPVKQEPRKSTIGARKTTAKKGGLGAKKGGLGAQKVKKDFAEIEREAELADQVRDRMEEDKAVTKVDEEKAVTSMRLAYQDLSMQQKKKEEKLRVVDPKKASQVERLGMGAGAKSSGITHSAIMEMNAISQDEPRGLSSSSRSMNKPRRDFDDDYDNFGGFDKDEDDWKPSSKRDDFSSSNSWEKEFEVLKTTNNTSSSFSSSSSNNKTEWNNNFESEKTTNGRRNLGSSNMSSSNTEDAQKKFGGAKSISSDMYFSGERDNGPDANLSRFSGSSSISSADYFGRQETTPGSRYSAANMNAPDMEDVKDSVKQGVSKVAGRLSNMASGVMTQLQDRYGY